MDDDCLPSVTALRELLTFGNRLGSDWGFLSSAVYWTDGSLCKANRAKRDLFRHVDSVSENDEAIRIVMGSFVSMLVPTKVIREVGLPIGEYFIWTDDYEFSGRVSKRYPSYLVPASKVIHAMAENTRADLAEAEGERINRFRILYRNDVHCYSGHGLPGRVYLVAKALYTAFDVGMRTEADGRKLKFRVLMEGYRDGLCFNPEISYPHIINGNETSHGDSSSMGSVSDSNYSAMVEG
jgi:GT2 family glycosyltransferase